MSKIGSYDFVAEPFHVDFNGKLTLGVLGNHSLNCAGSHAAERKIDSPSLKERNYTWVLSRLVIELTDMPNRSEKFTVRTWVEDVYRLFTNRNFAYINQDGHTIGYARSIWAIIDLSTRKPADLISVHGELTDYICDEPCPIAKPSHLKVSTQHTPCATLTAEYSDIDNNGHVNSIRYLEHILDLFPLEVYRTGRVRRFEIAYIAESYHGDELSFFKEETGEHEYSIEVRKNAGEVACRAKVSFEFKNA
jgi:acyl-ACP thioesterase